VEPIARATPGPGRLQILDADRVGQAAADIGISVPPGLLLVAVGEDGKHLARTAGSEAGFRAVAAILSRLDGKSVSECLRDLDGPGPDVGPKPAWWPPDDFFDNPETQRAYLAEYAKHPEWPRFFNSVGVVARELAQLAAPLIGTGAAGIVFREWLRQRGETHRTRIIQEHETARAMIRTAADVTGAVRTVSPDQPPTTSEDSAP
jgi:hypothetical protein